MNLHRSRASRNARAIMYLISFLIIMLPIICSSCISTQGISTAKRKRILLNSYLVKTVNRFYPDRTQGVPTQIFSSLNKEQLVSIQEELNEIAGALRNLHKKKFAAITAYLIPQVKKKVTSRVKIIANRPTAAETSRDGLITVDVNVLQSIFLGTVLETFQSDLPVTTDIPTQEDEWSPLFTREYAFDRAYNPSEATADQEAAIKWLSELVEEIEKMPSRSKLGDIIAAFHDDYPDYSDLTCLVIVLEVKYVSAANFLLAHEQGHFVLDHDSRWKSLYKNLTNDGSEVDEKTLCKVIRSFEAEADQYALLLLSPYTGGMKMSSHDLCDVKRNIVGYRNFLIYGYNLGGFKKSEGITCSYETNYVRFQKLEELNRNLQENLQRKFDEAMEKAFMAIEPMAEEEVKKVQEKFDKAIQKTFMTIEAGK